MRRPKLVAFIGVITVAIAGCTSDETPRTTQSPTPSPTTAASPQPSPSPAATKPTPGPSPTAQNSPAPAVSGLIQPTNSQERARQVQTEIKNQSRDPFAGLQPNIPVAPAASPQPVPSVAKLPPTTQPGTQPAGRAPNPAPNQPGSRPSSPNRGTTTARGTGGNTEGSPIQPKVAVASPSIPKAQGAPLGFNLPPVVPKSQTAALPPKPSTDTAKAVEVTGVITIGSTPQAIVIAPGDATSRYVSVGQRISNGRVLVKRIENNKGAEPVVILEENGVEVARSVGEKPPQATKPAS